MTFLFCLLVAYVMVRASEDVTSAVRKQPPPRQEIRTAKLAAREQGGRNVPQSPAGRYLTGLVDDAWDSAHHRRQLMADDRDRRRERRARNRVEKRQAKDQRRDDKRARKNGQVDEDQPQPVGFDVDAPEPAATEVVHPPSVDTDQPTAEPDAQTKWRNALAAGVDTGVLTSEEWNALPVEQRNQLIEEARAAGFSTVGHRPDGTATRLHQVPTGQPASEGRDADPGETDPLTANSDSKEDTPSNVIPFPTAPTQSTESPHRMELPTMSTPTGEITGLNSAINYAGELSTYCTHTNDQISSVLPTGNDAASSCEEAREALAAGGVTGQPLSDVTAVQEQMTEAVNALQQALSQLEAAGAAADGLRQRLTSHLSVQESYAANPDAGSKEFVTAD